MASLREIMRIKVVSRCLSSKRAEETHIEERLCFDRLVQSKVKNSLSEAVV